MRVLHLIKTSVGAAWALRQIHELIKSNIEVHVILPGKGPMVGKYTGAGAIEHLFEADFPTRTPWSFPALAARFRKLVGQIQPDIIHSHFVGTTLTMRLALGRFHKIPRVFQVPGPLHLENSFFRNTEIITSGPKDYWIGSCRWTCTRYLMSGISANRVFLSYYGTDVSQFDRTMKIGKLRRECSIDEYTKIVGMVAYMYAPKRYLGQRKGLKGHEDLIEALAICRRRMQSIIGVFIGGPWGNAYTYDECVRHFAREKLSDSAIFLGTRNDVMDLYLDFDVAVHPSHSENVGGAGESLLLGIPTIATNTGGFPDVVIPHKTGWLVPPKKPALLADAILEVLQDQPHARIIAKAGSQHARQLLDIKRNVKEIARVYYLILNS